jgi:hypothetical protein
MKIKSNSFLSLLLALPITSLASIPASAATLTWLGGTCSLGASSTSLLLGGCVKSDKVKNLGNSNQINDLHITLSVLNKNTQQNEELEKHFFFDAGTEPINLFESIWNFQELMGFGYKPEDQTTQAISIVDAKSYWTIGGNACTKTPGTPVQLHSSKTSGSKFAWGLLDPVLGFLITPAYAAEVCPVPEPDSSAGMVLMGTTLLLLGTKIKLKANNPSHT